ncbi:MAG: glycosyltransferase [Pseudomonadota bacterium]
MQLSIIIVNYKAWVHLEHALDVLREGMPDDWEVIVVDNESEARRLDPFKQRYSWVTFVANPANSGFAFGNNLGAAKASGEYLLFMNPDVVARCSELHRLLEAKKELPEVAILAPMQVDSKGRRQKVFDRFPTMLSQSKTLKALSKWFTGAKYPDPRTVNDELAYCDWVSGSVFMIDRAKYDELGGWSQDYWMYVEDTDFCWRATKRGWRVACLPTVVVTHVHGGSSRSNPAVAAMTKLEVMISKHVFVGKHFSPPKRQLTHFFLVTLRLPPLMLASLANLITLGRVEQLVIRSSIFRRLLVYYKNVLRTGSWRSPRSLAN